MNKKIIVVVVAAIIMILCLFSGIIKLYFPGRDKKAVIVAQEYLDTNYEQSMNYLSVETFFEPACYNVWFNPKDNTDIKFYVRVSPELSIYSENYIESKIVYAIESQLQEEINNIYNNADVLAIFNSSLKNDNIPEEFSLDEIKSIIDGRYRILITETNDINENNYHQEMNNIYEVVRLLYDKKINASNISFRAKSYINYESNAKEKNTLLYFSLEEDMLSQISAPEDLYPYIEAAIKNLDSDKPQK